MKKVFFISGIGVMTLVLTYTVTWGTLLASSNVLNHPFVRWPIWPIACTTRGCITSSSWIKQHELALAFSQAATQAPPAPQTTLTTVIRKYLVQHASVRSLVNPSDAERYRQDILHTTSEEQVRKYLPLSLPEYDKQVVTPFLQQEALRAERKVESTEELYKLLAHDRPVVLLLFHYRWDKDTGSAMPR